MLERPCYISKIRATKEKKGTAPYRACDAELAARVSKLAFSRFQVSDYFGNVGACAIQLRLLSFPFPLARFVRESIFVHSNLSSRLPLFNASSLLSSGLSDFFITQAIIGVASNFFHPFCHSYLFFLKFIVPLASNVSKFAKSIATRP